MKLSWANSCHILIHPTDIRQHYRSLNDTLLLLLLLLCAAFVQMKENVQSTKNARRVQRKQKMFSWIQTLKTVIGTAVPGFEIHKTPLYSLINFPCITLGFLILVVNMYRGEGSLCTSVCTTCQRSDCIVSILTDRQDTQLGENHWFF